MAFTEGFAKSENIQPMFIDNIRDERAVLFLIDRTLRHAAETERGDLAEQPPLLFTFGFAVCEPSPSVSLDSGRSPDDLCLG